MACPLPDDVKQYVNAIIKVCESRITANASSAGDAVEVALDKVEAVTLYGTIKSYALAFYTVG
jgi:hypothetical protein